MLRLLLVYVDVVAACINVIHIGTIDMTAIFAHTVKRDNFIGHYIMTSIHTELTLSRWCSDFSYLHRIGESDPGLRRRDEQCQGRARERHTSTRL